MEKILILCLMFVLRRPTGGTPLHRTPSMHLGSQYLAQYDGQTRRNSSELGHRYLPHLEHFQSTQLPYAVWMGVSRE